MRTCCCLLGLLSIFLNSCATPAPRFAANSKFEAAGEAGAKNDTAECTQIADRKLKERAEKGAMIGGAIGSLTGAGGGMTSGALGGAAVGEDTGSAKSTDKEQARRDLTDQCLKKRGYEVKGWS